MNINMRPEEYLIQKGWRYKPTGKEFKIETCPFCGDSKYHFSINQTTGMYHCFKCDCGGGIYSLKKHCGDLNAPTAATTTPNRILNTNISDLKKALYENNDAKKFLKDRGLANKGLIEQFSLGYDLKRNAIAFPYFENKKLINIKYRKLETKDFEKEAGCRSTIFNIDNIDTKLPLIIVEGEFDALAAWLMGFQNVCSLPDGASSAKHVAAFEKTTCEIIIATDCDNDGEKAAEKITVILGAFRCKRLLFPSGIKDFNDALVAGMNPDDIGKLIQEAKFIEKPEICTMPEMHERLLQKLIQQPKASMMTGWANFDSVLYGFRSGEVTVLTADTGIGKTTWAINAAYKLADKNHGVFIMSGEVKPEKITSKLYSIHSGKCFETITNDTLARSMPDKVFAKQDSNSCYEYYEKKNLLIWTGNELSLQKCRDLVGYMSVYNNTEFVVIDHLHYAINMENPEHERFEIEKFMRGIARLAIETETHILLIVHPNKEVGREGKVYMNMLKGSSAIKQEASNIMSLYRDRENLSTSTECWIQKCRDDAGREGKVIFDFDETCQRYVDTYKTNLDGDGDGY